MNPSLCRQRCHFAFHPHPLASVSAALACVSVGEYGSSWARLCKTLVCACSNTSAHRVALFSPSASEPVLVSFTSLTDQWGQTQQFFGSGASFFRVAPPEVVLSFFLNAPHSFLLQASSPPASGLIVRLYYLIISPLTPPAPTEVHRLQGVASLVRLFACF